MQELAAIQGCSKKKVEVLLKMRPFEGWGDLVSKVQSSKQLSTEMLNDGVVLVKLQRVMVRLMEKCDKIADKMAKLVEGLTSGESSKKLTEQPKTIPGGLKMTRHQIIGLNFRICTLAKYSRKFYLFPRHMYKSTRRGVQSRNNKKIF